MSRFWSWIPLSCVALACNPNTSRPPIHPILGASIIEVELDVPTATAEVAQALRQDSIPVTTLELRDGYLETPWFESATGVPTTERPLGPEVVRVRAWVDIEHPGHSRITVEVVYRPWADPSLPGRELERLAAADHPVTLRAQTALSRVSGQPPVPPTPPSPEESE
jgi:hypothetical protein